MAERVGFEPTVPYGITGFQDQLLKPLGHLSRNITIYYIKGSYFCQVFFLKLLHKFEKQQIQNPASQFLTYILSSGKFLTAPDFYNTL